MVCHYNNKMALRCGINSALIAGFLWYELKRNEITNASGKWVRASRKRIIAKFPFMGEKAVGNAVARLELANIITQRECNESDFDRTLSFAFTTYGKALMEEDEQYE